MKKLLIAAAFAALTAPVMAQTVNIYGVLDAGIRNDSAADNIGADRNALFSGVQSTSRFGLRGSEDLGGGLTARFQLEGGFNPTTGTSSQNGSTGTILFDRLAWIGLSDKRAGEIQIGRNVGATFDLAARGITDPLRLALDGAGAPVVVSNAAYGTSAARVNQAIYAAASTNGLRNTRANNMIKYTNSFGPIGVIAGFAPGGVTGDNSRSSATTYGVTASLLGINAGAAQFIANDATDKKATSTSYGANTRLGGATVTVGYHTVDTDAGYVPSHLTTTATAVGPILGTTATTGPSTQATIKNIGVRYEFSSKFATTLARYDGEYKNGAGSTGDLKTTVLWNEYSLSKRTNLYGAVDLSDASGAMVNTASTKAKSTGITAGIRHSF